WGFDISRWPPLCHPCLECGESLCLEALHLLRLAGMRVDPHTIASRTAEQFIHRYAEGFPLDIPQRLVDATKRAGKNRPPAIEGMPVNRLPVFRHRTRVLPNQVRLDFFDRF